MKDKDKPALPSDLKFNDDDTWERPINNFTYKFRLATSDERATAAGKARQEMPYAPEWREWAYLISTVCSRQVKGQWEDISSGEILSKDETFLDDLKNTYEMGRIGLRLGLKPSKPQLKEETSKTPTLPSSPQPSQ